ncbi:hypothetical protein [Spiroplasma clarkii]|nr:hypothetical protein [Spiroplasma clarkii]
MNQLDFKNINVILHSNLNENFIFNLKNEVEQKIYVQLEKIFTNKDSVLQLSELVKSQSIFLQQILNEKDKDKWFKKFTKKDYKFKLHLDESITDKIYDELKNLTKPVKSAENNLNSIAKMDGKIKINNKTYKFNNDMLKNAKKVFFEVWSK